MTVRDLQRLGDRKGHEFIESPGNYLTEVQETGL